MQSFSTLSRTVVGSKIKLAMGNFPHGFVSVAKWFPSAKFIPPRLEIAPIMKLRDGNMRDRN
jgi:hypothetical protein